MFKSFLIWLEISCGTDPQAFFVIAIMCSIGAYFTRGSMANPNGAFLIYPFLMTFALMANWLFTLAGLFDVKKMDQWLQAVTCSSVLGMICGLTLFILINKTINAVIDRHA